MNKKIDCPHCSGEIELKPKEVKTVEIDLSPPEPPKVPHIHTEPPKVPDAPDPHEVLADMLPSGHNFGKCKNGSCVEKVKNKKIVTSFKKCSNCGFNGVPESNSFCPVCGQDGSEWDESEINITENED